MKKRHLTVMPSVLLALLLTGLLIACPGTTDPVTVAVESVSIDQGDTASVAIDRTLGLTATVSPEDATDSSVTWKSGDDTIATIGSDGVVKGVAVGVVIITAMTNAEGDDGSPLSDTITITITVPDTESPVFNSGTTVKIAEDNQAYRVIYTATATDNVGIASYTLGTANDSGLFTIIDDTVYLTANLDYETKNSYRFEVIATDAAGNFATRTVTLTITDENDNAPVITNTVSTAFIADGATGVVYTVTSEDVDTDSTITYTLGEADSDAFTIATNGEVTIENAASYSTKPSYSFTITANDGANNSAPITVTITVVDTRDDTTAPTVSNIGYSPDTAVSGGPITYTISFDEAVTHVNGETITTNNGTLTVTGSGDRWTVVVTPVNDGTVTLTVGTGITDIAGNHLDNEITNDAVTYRAPTNIALASANLVEVTTDVPGWWIEGGTEGLVNVNDGNKSTEGTWDFQAHPTDAAGKHITFTFNETYSNGSFLFYNRVNGKVSANARINGSTVQFYNDDTTVGIEGILNVDNATIDGIITITQAVDVVFNKVVITFPNVNDEDNNQNFREIEIMAIPAP